MSKTNGVSPFAETSLAHIHPWPGNPRKTFDEGQLGELAESIRAKGVLQPLLVRPMPTARVLSLKLSIVGRFYELADGERRYRAAKLAGLEHVPVRVLELTDRDMLEIAVVSFEQRADVSPAERAAGYARLVEEHGATVEEIAAKVGRSTSTIRGMLRLTHLPERARKALDAGELSQSVAELIAARPSEAMRAKVASMALQPWRGQERPSYRDVKQFITRECMVELKQAPFSQKDETLTSAGACTVCPLRTGNDRETYPDGRADLCTSPECYRAKVKAHQERLATAAKAEGKTVLSAKEAAKLFDQYSPGRLRHDSGYVDLDTLCYDPLGYNHPSRGKPWRKLIGKHVAGDVVLAYDAKGTLHSLAPKAIALKVLKKHHGVQAKDKEPETEWDRKRKQQEARERREHKAGKAAALKAAELVAEKAQRWMGAIQWTGAATDVLRGLAMVLPGILWSDACRRVRQRRNLPSGDDRKVVRAEAGNLQTAPELMGLIAELVGSRLLESFTATYSTGKVGEDARPFWEAFDIDLSKLRKEAEVAAKTKREAKVKCGGCHQQLRDEED